jgi:hypothetical protein
VARPGTDAKSVGPIAPAGSRSDKKQRHPRSKIWMSLFAEIALNRNVERVIPSAWRGFLLLAQPGRPAGTAGPPELCFANERMGAQSCCNRSAGGVIIDDHDHSRSAT